MTVYVRTWMVIRCSLWKTIIYSILLKRALIKIRTYSYTPSRRSWGEEVTGLKDQRRTWPTLVDDPFTYVVEERGGESINKMLVFVDLIFRSFYKHKSNRWFIVIIIIFKVKIILFVGKYLKLLKRDGMGK